MGVRVAHIMISVLLKSVIAVNQILPFAASHVSEFIPVTVYVPAMNASSRASMRRQ